MAAWNQLYVGADGPTVRALHAVLLDGDGGAAPDEVVAGFYGPSTRQAVLVWQRRNGLPPTGVVDADTAAALGIDGADDPAGAVHRVVGRVLDARLTPLGGVTVTAVDRELRDERVLGTARTDADGYYTIEYRPADGGDAGAPPTGGPAPAANVVVRVTDRGRVLWEPTVGQTRFQAGRLCSVPVTLDVVPRRGPSQWEQLDESLTPLLGGLTPAALQEDAERQDVSFLVGRSGEAADAVTYWALAHRLATPDIPAEFFFAVLSEQALRDVRTWRSLRPRFTVDIHTPVDGLRADIVLLPDATIEAAVKNALAAGTVPASLGRQLPGVLAALRGEQEAARGWIAHQVPQLLADQLHDLLDSTALAAVQQTLAGAHGSDLATVLGSLDEAGGALTAGRGLDARTRAAVADLIGNEPTLVATVARRRRITGPEQVHRLAAMAPKDWAAALGRGAKSLARPSTALSQAMAGRHAAALARSMEAAFPTAAYAAQLGRDPDPVVPHAKEVAALLRGSPEFDLARGNVATLLDSRRSAAGGRRARAGRGAATATAAAAGTPLAEPGTVAHSLHRVQRVFRVAPRYGQAKALLGAGLGSADDIRRVGRTRFVTTAVGSGAFTAPEAHAAFDRAETAGTGSMLLAGSLAANTAALTIPGLHGLIPPHPTGGLGGLGGPTPLAPPSLDLEPVTTAFPNLRSLFGSADSWSCEECRAVHGPSAYAVDVLQFLKHRLVTDTTVTPAVTEKVAKDVLFSRRPDLGDTDLSCPNTNTELPYIDLVCEILEDAVAPDPGFGWSGALAPGAAPAGLVTALQAQGLPATAAAVVYEPDLAGRLVVRDTGVVCSLTPAGASGWTVRRLRQTYGSSAAVSAAPEYVNPTAYARLAASRAAFGLPFDLAHEEARSYFATFGVDRLALMRALATAAAPTGAQLAAEQFGLSEPERVVVVTPDPGGQKAIWTTATATAAATLDNVDAFVVRSGIAYTDLLDLLGAAWINPGDTMYVRHLDSTADLSAKVIVDLDDAALDRIHRFWRLRTATGWSTVTLDRVLRAPALGAGSLDDAALAAAADLARLGAALGLGIEAATDLFAELDPSDPTGTYARTFLDPSSVGAVDADFTAAGLSANDARETATPGSGLTLADKADYLALALGRTPTDVGVLLTRAGPSSVLDLASVSRIHAWHALALALGVGPAELQVLLTLLGADPLTSPAAALAVVTARAGLGAAPREVAYWLGHATTGAADTAARELPDATVAGVLDRLTTAYAAAAAASASEVDAGSTPAENLPALTALLTRLPGVTTTQLAAVQTLVTSTWTDMATTPAQFVDQLLAAFLDTTAVQAAVTALLAVTPPTDALRNDVVAAMASAVSAHLEEQARAAALRAELATTFSAADDVVDVLLVHARLTQPPVVPVPRLGDVLQAPGTGPADLITKGRAVRAFAFVLAVATAQSFTAQELGWLLDYAGVLGWTELDTLPYEAGQPAAPFDGWVRLQAYRSVHAALPDVADPADATRTLSVTGLFDVVLAAGSTATDVLAHLAGLAGLDAAVLADLDTRFGLSVPDLTAYHDPAVLTRLTAAARLLRQLGLDVAGGVAVAAPQLGAGDAATLRTALKARYSDADWLGVLAQTYGAVRPRKRDALVAYLLAHNPDLAGVDDLYAYFLIDVEMGPCMATSRIVQMHATLQLFVQRCLMGLEPAAVAGIGADDGWAQWKWMANYRVWQANREIFLWPENWIAPELRDDRSELFLALDNTLQQNALTDDTVGDAAAAYLESLDDIARLEVMATYYQVPTRTLHVFARTRGGSPSVYYHRTFVRERAWTPWTRIPLDIDSDHLLAFERNDRLTLAWAIFTEQPDRDAPPPPIPDPNTLGGGRANDPPSRQWQIQLATSEQSRGAWRPKKVSRGYLATDWSTSLPPKEQFNLFSWSLGANQAVSCTGPGFTGSFSLTGCQGYPEPQPSSGATVIPSPVFKDAQLRANRFTEQGQDGDDQLAIRTVLQSDWSTITDRTPGTFQVTYPLQMSLLDWIVVFVELWASAGASRNATVYEGRRLALPLGTLMPYFYGDYDRNYVIVPGFYARDGAGAATERTFSDIEQDVEDVVALLAKYLSRYAADPAHDLVALIAALKVDPEFVRLTAEWKYLRELRYGLKFANFYHPLVCRMRSAFTRSGPKGLLDRDLQLTDTGFDFATTYGPSPLVVAPYPREDVDFALDAAYASYNWELFFHLPFDIATRLNRDQQFEAARSWFHYVFDPVGSGDGPAPQRYWITKPFFQTTPADYLAERIDVLLGRVAADPAGTTIGDLAFAIEQWRDEPFSPDVVARSRRVAYQIALVNAYVSNLIDMGDAQFRPFTREGITSATQSYVLAATMMGASARVVPPPVPTPVMTYNQLEADVDLFGNALIDLENLVPDLAALPHGGAELPPPPATFGLPYFCIPANDAVEQLRAKAADRLFKIRHSQNIDGVEASLALFSPPIDPGALVRAAAAGLDASAVVAGLGAPLPSYRFVTMAARAVELTQHVAMLGNQLLAALERRDTEYLARMHENQEIEVLDAVRATKQAAIDEANAAIGSLQRARLVTQARRDWYSSQPFMNPWEIAAVALNGVSLLGEGAVALGYVLSGGLKLIPAFEAGGAGFGGSPTVTVTLGGQTVGAAADSAAQVLSALARVAEKGGQMAGTQAAYQRRQDEWDLQVTVADRELQQIDQQIVTATLHVGMLTGDLAAHDVSRRNAAQTGQWLTTKYTGQELYEWLGDQLTSVYYAAYTLAYDTAKKAERCFGHELGSDATFVRYGYWDGARKGLGTADALMHDIERMQAAYLDLDRRDYELTKHVSLALVDPQALVTLKNTGTAIIELPEAMFDLDHPGHYFRRIRSVALSIPCVAGPYTTIACTLTQIGNRYRATTDLTPAAVSAADKYVEQDGSDPRFAYNIGTISAIATSTAVADGGVFDLDFHDPRYLPFEGTGAISRWRLELPQEFPQFDHQSISDVVLHVRYTARDGGSAFRTVVEGGLTELVQQQQLGAGEGLFAGVSLRTQYPDLWWQLVSTGTTTLVLDEQVLPYAMQSHHPVITQAGWYAKVTGDPASFALTVGADALTLNRNPALGKLCIATGGAPAFGTPVTLTAGAGDLEDLVLLVRYSIS